MHNPFEGESAKEKGERGGRHITTKTQRARSSETEDRVIFRTVICSVTSCSLRLCGNMPSSAFSFASASLALP